MRDKKRKMSDLGKLKKKNEAALTDSGLTKAGLQEESDRPSCNGAAEEGRGLPPGPVRRALCVLGALWALFVAGAWFYTHTVKSWRAQKLYIFFGQFWEKGTLLRAIGPLIALFSLYGVCVGLTWIFRGRVRFPLRRLTAAKVGLLFIVAAWAVWIVAAFFRSIPGTGTSNIPDGMFFETNFFFLFNLLLLLGWAAALTLSAHALGALALRLFRPEIHDALPLFLFRYALGLGALSMVVFVLGMFRAYYWWSILPIALLAVVAAWRETWDLVRSVFVHSWETPSAKGWLREVLVILILAMAAMTAVDVIRPVPLGWDDLTSYMVKARLVADRHALVPGNAFFFPVQLLTSIGFTFTASAMPSLAVAWMNGVLSAIAVFAFGKRFWDARTGLLAATIWYTMPMVGFLACLDTKTDTTVFLISAMAIWGVLEWGEAREQTPWLVLASLMVGVAATLKITAAFLLFALAVTFGFFLVRWPASWMRKIKTVVITGALVLLPSVPWLGLNLASRSWHLSTSPLDWVGSVSWEPPVLPESEIAQLHLPPQPGVSTATQEDQVVYSGELKGFSYYLLMPWYVTMNTYSGPRTMVIIGFTCLAFLLLLPLSWRKRSAGSSPVVPLVVFALAYWSAWMLGGKAMAWYGLPGFLALSVMVALVVDSPTAPNWFRQFTLGLVLISILANLTIHGSQFGDHLTVQYAGGVFDTTGYVNSSPFAACFSEIARVIEENPPHPGSPNRVYRVGTMVPFYIKDIDRRVLSDMYLESFNALDMERNDTLTYNRLKQLGFRYIILDLNIVTNEEKKEGTLHRKAIRFTEFANNCVQNGRMKILLYHQQDPGVTFLELIE